MNICRGLNASIALVSTGLYPTLGRHPAKPLRYMHVCFYCMIKNIFSVCKNVCVYVFMHDKYIYALMHACIHSRGTSPLSGESAAHDMYIGSHKNACVHVHLCMTNIFTHLCMHAYLREAQVHSLVSQSCQACTKKACVHVHSCMTNIFMHDMHTFVRHKSTLR
jgi:hypothetical protein